MEKKIQILIHALLLTILPLSVFSAEPWVSFRHIGIEEGLSNSTVPSVTQDSLGYIWVATHDGLNRYDGHTFKTYRTESGVAVSLPENVIKKVDIDSRSDLWILSDKNLTRYNRLLDNFEPYTLPENDGAEFLTFAPLDSSALLVGTDRGIYRFDIARHRFSPMVTGLSVNALAISSDSCFFTTPTGVFAIPLGGGSTRQLRKLGAQANTLLAQGPHHIWIGTEGAGVWLHNTLTGSTERFDNASKHRIISPFVRSLGIDKDGKLWVGTVSGLSSYNPLTDSTRSFTSTSLSEKPGATPLSHASVRSIFSDKRGGLWVGTWYGGLNYYHPLQNRFRNIGAPPLNDNVVSCIVPDKNLIYIGTNSGGLNIYNTSDETFEYITRANGLSSADVKAVHIDSEHRLLYIGTHLGGLSVFSLDSHKLVRELPSPAKLYSIEAADGGRLWLGTLDGLYLYTPATNSAREVPITLRSVTDIFRDSKGRLWMSGESGVALFREEVGGKLTPIALPASSEAFSKLYITNIYESAPDGNFWISTRNGLWQLDPGLELQNHYTVDDGLPNNIVLGVLADSQGDYWISTNLGLSKFNPATGTFHNYGQTDHLGVRQFNAKAVAAAGPNRMYFGGIGGIVTFNPEEITPDTISARPLINGVRLFGTPAAPGDATGILRRTLETGRKIILKPEQSMITLEFTAFNFHNNGHDAFRYRLKGLDKDWIEVDDERSATYRNLPPGTYNFEVQSANSDGIWSETRSIEVRMLPHWYQQWWAQLIGIIIIIAAAVLLVRRFTIGRLREQKREFEKRDFERREELNDMKVNFFVNMSHELRTPLTLILLPVTELIEQKRNEPKVLDKLQTIRGNTMRILNIINQILDYQRAENGMFRLRVRPLDVNTLLSDEMANYSQKARHSKITCRIDSTVGDTPIPLDPTYMSIIIGNLLSNAFKHTPEGRSVTLCAELSDGDNNLIIKVSDTGHGIDPAKLPHIFDRFYKVDENSYGSGIGLSLVKRLVTLHHGMISVDSAPDKGTSFTIVLPAKADAYSADETEHDNSASQRPVNLHYITEADTPEPEADEAQDSSTESKERSLMLVDDNDTILKYMREALAPHYRIILAHDGQDALDKLETETPDMIITDVMMPRVNGIQLCRALKRNIRTSHIPVMMLSAKSDVRDQLDAMKVGADDYLPKPFSMPLLLAKIANRFRTRASAIRYYTDTPDIEPAKMAMNPLDEEFLASALATVEKHIDDSEFTTDGFAREMLMSRSNLHLKLKALTGESANEFIRRIRMNRALELLKTGRYTVAEVSAMVGYGTPSYFSTSFKKFFGNQPSDYAKS